MPNDWRTVIERIEELSQQVEASTVLETVDAFVRSASSAPAPGDVGLGYWRNSLRFTWPTFETEIFSGSIEIYHFTATGTQISTIPFAIDDPLPTALTELLVQTGSPFKFADATGPL